MKRILSILAGAVALAAGGLLAAGFLRSPDMTFQASMDIARPASAVFDVVSNLENLPKWSSEITSVEKLSDNPRKYSVKGASGDPTTVEFLAFEPGRRYVSRMASPAMGFSGDWDIAVEPRGERASRIRSVAKMRLNNVIYRSMSVLMDGNKEEEKTLLALKTYLESRP